MILIMTAQVLFFNDFSKKTRTLMPFSSNRPKTLCLVYTFKTLSIFLSLCCYAGFIFIKTYLAYAITWKAPLVMQQQKSFPNWPEISFLLKSASPNVAQKSARISIICILNFNVSLGWLVGEKSPIFS